MSKDSRPWFVYLLDCASDKLYCGITTDLEKRFNAHVLGKGAKYTRANPPVRMIAAQPCETRSEASKLEWQTKQLTALEKRSVALRWAMLEELPAVSPIQLKKAQ